MQAVIRETITKELLQVPKLVDAYEKREPRFVGRTLKWLANLESELAKLRHPLTASVSGRRGDVLATLDGFRPSGFDQLASRKAARAFTAHTIGEVEAQLRGVVDQVDVFLNEMSEKMAQLLAVATAEHPIPLPPTEPREAWLRAVWDTLNQGNGTGMYRYLNARLTRVDRFYILDQILRNMIEDE